SCDGRTRERRLGRARCSVRRSSSRRGRARRREETLRLPLCLCACAVLAGAPLATIAQTQATFLTPKLVTRGSNTTPLAGAGSVTVQVMVKKDGTFPVGKVIKSTNEGDNTAALEIAKPSTYAPATRDGKKVDAYYDFELAFNGDTAATGSGP